MPASSPTKPFSDFCQNLKYDLKDCFGDFGGFFLYLSSIKTSVWKLTLSEPKTTVFLNFHLNQKELYGITTWCSCWLIRLEGVCFHGQWGSNSSFAKPWGFMLRNSSGAWRKAFYTWRKFFLASLNFNQKSHQYVTISVYWWATLVVWYVW